MKESYIVLRVDGSSTISGPPPVRGAKSGLESVTAPQSPSSATIKPQELEPGEALELGQEAGVEAVVPALPLELISPLPASDDASVAPQAGENTWGVEAVGAHTSPYDGSEVVVAVIDTGIVADHPAFADVELCEKNFTDGVDHDTDGHGTHCAGTIFGGAVDGVRIGVAPGVKRALIAKVLGENGATTGDVAEAVQWALSGGANVISMSLGIDFPGYVATLIDRRGVDKRQATSIALEGFLQTVELYRTLAEFMKKSAPFKQAATIVAASGNESDRRLETPLLLNVAPPASAPGIRSVGAVGRGAEGYEIAYFSNAKPDVVGPGVDVWSAAIGGGLKALNGTSMATPHVAGVTALWADRLLKTHNRLSIEALESDVRASAEQNGMTPGFKQSDVGSGLVRAPQER